MKKILVLMSILIAFNSNAFASSGNSETAALKPDKNPGYDPSKIFDAKKQDE